METDYNRDLVKGRFTSKATIGNYIKENGKLAEPEKEANDDKS